MGAFIQGHVHQWQYAARCGTVKRLAVFVCECGAWKEVRMKKVEHGRS
jgi:hypothetical protein